MQCTYVREYLINKIVSLKEKIKFEFFEHSLASSVTELRLLKQFSLSSLLPQLVFSQKKKQTDFVNGFSSFYCNIL